MRRAFSLMLMGLLALSGPAAAQLSMPQLGVPQLPGGVLEPVAGALDQLDDAAQRTVDRLARARLTAIDRLVRRYPDRIELDRDGAPARRGILLVTGALDEASIARLAAEGFVVAGVDRIEGLGFSVTRLRVPGDMSLAKAQALFAATLPGVEASPDNLHFEAGERTSVAAKLQLAAAGSARAIALPVGMIDGAAGPAVPVAAVKGFAQGAPLASNHGSAVASLLAGAGVQSIRVADVYGSDPAGGNALAIARGLGWLVAGGSKVVTISLVGPKNAVLARAIAAAQARGVVVVAAVGNDGPAAPPAYPASYDGVVAVTAVDKRDRALIEAGRATHLDYAAPGADIYGRSAKGKRMRLRGTSFATPLVAARVAQARAAGSDWRKRLDAEARDLGRKGPDPVYGRGLLCSGCAAR